MFPLHAFSVTLQVQRDITLPFFHQPLLQAFLYHLLGDMIPKHDGFAGLTFDAPETGKSHYYRGDYYRFVVFVSGCGVNYLPTLFQRLKALPDDSSKLARNNGIYPHQVTLHSLTDLFAPAPSTVVEPSQLISYGETQLAYERAYWREHQQCKVQLLSPIRLKRTKHDCEQFKLKRDMRYCRHLGHLSPSLFWQRLQDTFAKQARDDGKTPPPRQSSPLHIAFDESRSHLFWADNQYGKHEKSVGGLLGEIMLTQMGQLSDEQLDQLILGQYTGFGQLRSSGLGRYKLVTQNQSQSFVHYHAASPMLLSALENENMMQAWQAICENKPKSSKDDIPFSDIEKDIDSVEWRFEQIRDDILQGQYKVAPLYGHVIDKPQGGVRALAIPTFWERVIQRAVTQVLNPALEQYYDPNSYGYRAGRSRVNAKEHIEQAYQEGYQWVFEADINDFFDSVDWHILEHKLTALYRFDPIITLLMDWIRAPVDYQGYTVERDKGLPQGCPVSPMLANIMLDEFDADLTDSGFRLIRYADDFVVLCKNQQQAQEAGIRVKQKLAELGLSLDSHKSGVVSFEQGFKYLGYLFVDSLVIETKKQKDVTRTVSEAPSGWLKQVFDKKPELLKKHGLNISKEVGEASIPEQGSTLIISGEHAVLSNKAKQLQIIQNDQVVNAIPWSTLHSVLLIGSHHISTPAMRTALSENVAIHFADSMGAYQGCLTANQPNKGAMLWLQQAHKFSEHDSALLLAQSIVTARIAQQQETLRQRLPKQDYSSVQASFAELKHQVKNTNTLAELNGTEGLASKHYFAQLKPLVPPWCGFTHRKRRPPPDPFNALLSLGYTLLYSINHSLIVLEGLQPWLGFYHQPRGTHAALASDLMEPFRHIVERHALNSINEIKQEDFNTGDNGACWIAPKARRKYLATLWKKLHTTVTHQQKSGEYLWQIQHQIQQLILHLRDDNPFIPYGIQ